MEIIAMSGASSKERPAIWQIRRSEFIEQGVIMKKEIQNFSECLIEYIEKAKRFSMI